MNDNDYQEMTKKNRQFLEELGAHWESGFENLVEMTRKDLAKEGRFMSFDEAAYHLTQGGVDHYKETGRLD